MLEDDSLKTIVKARKRRDCERMLPKPCGFGIPQEHYYVLLIQETELMETLDSYCKQKCGHTITDKQTFQRCMEKACRVALVMEHFDFAREMNFKQYEEMKIRRLLELIKPDIL